MTEQIASVKGSSALGDAMLSVHIIKKLFTSRYHVEVLGGIDFVLSAGETVAILGPSGAGKTTLLRMIAGLDPCFEGEIRCAGRIVAEPGASRSLVFQDARLLPWRTVRQNVAFGLPVRELSAGADRIDYALRLVGIEGAQHAWPRELSGGMEKRVALARAIVGSPRLMLLDEPFGALDPSARFTLQSEYAALSARLNLTTLLVTHDVEEAVFLGDRVILLGGHPTQITGELPVSLPRPRDRTSRAFDDIRREALASMLGTQHLSLSQGPGWE